MTTFRPKFSPSRRTLLKGTGAMFAGLTLLPRFSLSAEEKKLNFYNWDTYIGETFSGRFHNGHRHRGQDGSVRRQ